MVTIHNDEPRRDVAGDIVDAHDGKVVAANGRYYLYGESYGNQTLSTSYPWKSVPRLKVYTSPDLVAWTLRGDPLPMISGTLWIPNVIYNATTGVFLMWFGSGGWRSATSTDGVHFTPSSTAAFYSRFGPRAGTDGTGIFIDDDGAGYVAFAASPAELPDHVVSIERLADDYLSTARQCHRAISRFVRRIALAVEAQRRVLPHVRLVLLWLRGRQRAGRLDVDERRCWAVDAPGPRRY